MLQRRLATILAADAVGYSYKMAKDEGSVYAELSRCRAIIDQIIDRHGGRIFGSAGDSVLAEFSSSVNAVDCAIDIQQRLEATRSEAVSDPPLSFRIGINFGDVIIDDENLLGDGVNVAARLESIAPENGICLPGNVMEQVSGKTSAKFGDGGKHKLKNIEKPIHVWCWPENASYRLKRAAIRRSGALVASLLSIAAALVFIAGYLYFQSRQETPPVADKASIAVMPFANKSGDPEEEYLVDGITSDLITDLSKISGLFVIARNSTFAYKGQAIKPQKVAAELGVRYILEGSIRTSNGQLRINSQLIDANSGGQIWADRFDRTMGDLFALQDNVTNEIVSALEIQLTPDEEKVLEHSTQTTTSAAYDLFLKGLNEVRKFTPQSTRTARLYFLKALAIDTDYARAYAAIAFSYVSNAIFFAEERSEEAFLMGLNYAQRALQLDPTLPQGHLALSLTYQRLREHQKALASAQAAVRHDPNYSDGYAVLAAILAFIGDGQQAEENIRIAMSLNPRFPSAYTEVLGRAQFVQGHLEKAIESFRNCISLDPMRLTCRVYLAAVYGLLERKNEAEWEAQEILSMNPDFDLSNNIIIAQFERQQHRDKLKSGLRVAGIPEK